ncbi:MAG: hypothetical protein ACYSVY_26330 [Planctomycetota bacterium]
MPTLDTGIRPGTIIRRQGWNNITRVGQLGEDKAISAQSLRAAIEGPTHLGLQNFAREYELSVGAAVDLIQPTSSSARAKFKRAKKVEATFEAPNSFFLSLTFLSDAVAADPDFWERSTGRRLEARNRFVVFQVIKAKLSLAFIGTGNLGIDVKVGPGGDMKSTGLGFVWKWKNKSTLTSPRELVVAMEMARYKESKKLFIVE